MALHLIKLCVGVAEIAELRDWQERRLAELGRVFHVTRMMPKRVDEILDGGSMYWVTRGVVQVRQRIEAIEGFADGEGVSRCRIVFDPELVPTMPQPRRAFQGWRYLDPADAPRDLPQGRGLEALPEHMRAELIHLGLL